MNKRGNTEMGICGDGYWKQENHTIARLSFGRRTGRRRVIGIEEAGKNKNTIQSLGRAITKA
jgi:hypothetical protein